MYVVIFRAKIRQLDAEYAIVATRMRELALHEFGCQAFHAATEGDTEIALSYWPSEQHIRDWKAHPEHVLAQQSGRKRWYDEYSVEIAQITRAYQM